MGSMKSKDKENIDEEDKNLVDQLKQVCDNEGRENDPFKSGPILYKLGKIYHLQGKQDSDPIYFIQSAGLYNAAIIRLPNQKQQIERDLKQLCKDILRKAEAENQHADLVKQAHKVKSKFEALRKSVNGKLNLIPRITKLTPESEVKTLEQQKTNLVRDLQQHTTERYTNIMAGLAKYCHDVMGKPPCKFALIGMGSIARKEITPYSDFEHIIGLEDEVLEKRTEEELENSLSYFRWFSMLFQLVVINLGETIIPSLGISLLNDFYGEQENENWFFDKITPRGISFDGMMPHACKFPVGRQRPTEKKPWKAELIKPITQMLEYLTEESRLKQGYHLDDILTKTCFVYGDEKIFQKFQTGVAETLSKQSKEIRADSVKNQINEDLDNFATRSTLFQIYMQQDINIKKVAYRSSTLFITAMGRICNIHEPSCFDIIEKLAEMNEISELAKQKQMYAVSIACEMRLRWYMENKSQADFISTTAKNQNTKQTLFNIVGVSSTKSYFQIAYAIQCDISKRLGLKKLHFHSNPQLLNFSISLCMINEPKKQFTCIEKSEIRKTKFDRLYSFDDCMKILLEEKWILRDSLRKKGNDKITFFAALLEAGNILCSVGCYDDALEYYQKSLQIKTDKRGNAYDIMHSYERQLTKLSETNVALINDVVSICAKIGECLIEIKNTNEGGKYLRLCLDFQDTVSTNQELDLQLSNIFFNLGRCSLDSKNHIEAFSYFKQAERIQRLSTVNVETDSSLANTLYLLGQCWMGMNKCKDALDYLDESVIIKTQATKDAETDISLANTLRAVGQCYQKLKINERALEYLERSLQITKQASTNIETDLSLAFALFSLGQCWFDMNNPSKALENFQKSLRIHERTTMDAGTDVSLGNTLKKMGLCLLDTNQCEEALKYFDRWLSIQERKSSDADLADNLYELGFRLLEANQCKEALKYFNQLRQIQERTASMNAKADTKSQSTLHFLGHCLLNLNQSEEALQYFEQSLKIQKRTHKNTTADADAATLLGLGRCLLHTNQYNEALIYLKKSLIAPQLIAPFAKSEKDKTFALSLHYLGQCLMNMNQFKDALDYLQRSKELQEQLTQNAQTRSSLAATLKLQEQCLIKMNRSDE